MEKLKKKGQVGQTLTWIIATLIIFFILVFFVLVTTVLVGFKKISSPFAKNEIEVGQEVSDYAGFKSFEGFLNSEIGEKKVKVYDIVANADKGEMSEEFKKEALKFLDFNFPNAKNDNYKNSWIRIYSFAEEASKGDSGYEKYEVKKAGFGDNCDPNGKKVIVNSFVILNNKIVLCSELR